MLMFIYNEIVIIDISWIIYMDKYRKLTNFMNKKFKVNFKSIW
jgi:hypothetical protein